MAPVYPTTLDRATHGRALRDEERPIVAESAASNHWQPATWG